MSAIDTLVSLEISWYLDNTFESWSGLLATQSFWGANLILAPLAPPLISVPLKVDALAHAVSTISEIDNPELAIFSFAASISKDLFPWGIGSCQIKSSSGTSGPK